MRQEQPMPCQGWSGRRSPWPTSRSRQEWQESFRNAKKVHTMILFGKMRETWESSRAISRGKTCKPSADTTQYMFNSTTLYYCTSYQPKRVVKWDVGRVIEWIMYPAGVMEPTLESRSWKLPPPVAKVTLFLFTVNTGKVIMMIMMVVTIKTGPE